MRILAELDSEALADPLSWRRRLGIACARAIFAVAAVRLIVRKILAIIVSETRLKSDVGEAPAVVAPDLIRLATVRREEDVLIAVHVEIAGGEAIVR